MNAFQGTMAGIGMIPFASIEGGFVKNVAVNVEKSVAERGLWKLTEEGASKIKRHNTWGTLYRSASDGLWWTKDITNHGESAFQSLQRNKQRS